MNKSKFISDFCQLGTLLNKAIEQNEVNIVLTKTEQQNAWFTKESVKYALAELSKTLTCESLDDWLKKYPISENLNPKTIGLVLAGNIPLVGFHDILCVLATGNIALAKLSHKDQHLYKYIKQLLLSIDNAYENLLCFTNQPLKNIDAIIATGSNNSSRYFDYYFSKYPNIIRKNRNSVAIIDNTFEPADYKALGEDIFTYFGLGCRNVSFLLLPENYNIQLLCKELESYNYIIGHNKYANNYSYQRALLAMNKIPFYDTGFSLFTENNALNSPIAIIHYTYYKDETELNNLINNLQQNIQCIVSKTKHSFNTYSLGMAQKPALNDYADNIDTIEFLLNL